MVTPQPPPARGLSPAQIQMMQQQMATEAAKNNMTLEQYIEHLKAQATKHAQAQKQAAQQQQQQQQHQHHHGPNCDHDHDHDHEHEQHHVHLNSPGAPNPQAIALAKWLRGQNLKSRTCILNGQRKDMFKVKRVLRILQSPDYAKACAKSAALPPVTDRASAENVFKLLPLSLLALRVSKIDSQEGGAGGGHGHGKGPKKRVKGLWTVKIEQQQEVQDGLHFVWLYEGPQWKQKLYAVGALVVIMAVVLFPLWPIKLRIGVWYLSMAMLGLIGLFFAMSIFRLILFCLTVFVVPPGLWLYPNLFEDVGFFDSFRPVWGWQEDKKKKKQKKSVKGEKAPTEKPNNTPTVKVTPAAGFTSTRDLTPRVEEVEDD
ncbi:MAG: Translocation protein S62 [Peltula sp. TS41687]|nr:MAG: Translocation protein S62 [Peltula sp. TS41687]